MASNDIEQRRRELASAVLDRIASDESFRRQLLDDPDAALRATDFGERAAEIEQAIHQGIQCASDTCEAITCAGGPTCRFLSCAVTG